ncbi:Orotidine 5'-phosphate decarboxylase [Granulibacter bethesdensis]|uniref:Orotidine 5'-phosphate decarboxylase n=1 Tax=Granulibacter bethesdensis TaxID=364410 RepID=A0AAC9KBJ8_9PROT|nr:orotidine-5'-phosphate decarboxylase [Granulibacter bethesdensis]APH55334.1 Orotidine 5'-phosphate decarboxylase [Granulibacter bethesdensis]APH62921.1 Orotidine 5'-phosphate decarboxylase [Granulibacter bethesdensis]
MSSDRIAPARSRPSRRVIVSLDTPDPATARAWNQAFAPYSGMSKLGLEYYLANGPQGMTGFEGPIFLDLKLHDIPNTVAAGVRSVLPLKPALLTVHAGGGSAMVAAARNATGDATDRTRILAVTILTSLDAEAVSAIGFAEDPALQVLRLAKLAVAAGADGLVCSAHEAALLRAELGPEPLLVVPGIRPAGSETGDQSRTMTPRAAIEAGADYIVVGRPITQAPDPVAAASSIAADIAGL